MWWPKHYLFILQRWPPFINLKVSRSTVGKLTYLKIFFFFEQIGHFSGISFFLLYRKRTKLWLLCTVTPLLINNIRFKLHLGTFLWTFNFRYFIQNWVTAWWEERYSGSPLQTWPMWPHITYLLTMSLALTTMHLFTNCTWVQWCDH